MTLEPRKIAEVALQPRPIVQAISIGAFGLIITLTHKFVHLHTLPLVMILIQKLYFIPVILAGFWSGSVGGLSVAFVCAVLSPHRGSMHMTGMPIFTAAQTTDIGLLFIVGGITGWLRNRLNAELEHHRRTAEERDQALGEANRSCELARRSEHLASLLGQMADRIAHEVATP